MAAGLFRRVVVGAAVGSLAAAAVLGGCLGASSSPEPLGTNAQAVHLEDATTEAVGATDAAADLQGSAETKEASETLATESASEQSAAEAASGEAESGAPACAGDPSVVLGDGGAICTGNLAEQTFQRAICTCGSLTTSGGLTTDGFNSTIGPPDGGLGGNVAVDQDITWSSHVSVGGDLVVPDTLQASATGTVRGNLYLGGHGTASATVTVDGNAYLVGALPHDVTVDGTVSTVASVAAECNCGDPLPVAAIVAAHRPPANDDAAIGLSSTAATGSHASRIDLPCGNYYLTQVDVSSALVIWAHGHTALFIDGSIVASAPLTFGLDEGATLDLFVAGNVETSAMLTLGETTAPASCRAYVSGSLLAMSGGSTLGCNVYAPSAAYDSSGVTTVYGSLFVDSIAASAAATVHYDMAVQSAGGECCTASSCNDNDPCTTDSCAANGTCTHTPVANGTACTGTNLCEQSYTCQAGACVGSNPVVCAASGPCSTAGTCNPATGQCTTVPVANGTPCSTGNLCFTGDTCQSGACINGSPVVCTASGPCTTVGTCNPATGQCNNPPVADGTSCSTGNLCFTGDTCQSGACANGSPVVCTASGPCTSAGTCNPATGACTNPQNANSTACTTGNLCFVGDTCQAGACVNGTPVTCAASGPCTTSGVCSPATGLCTNPALPDGTACTNGDLCFTADTCLGGTCANGTPVACAASGPCTTAGTCDPSTGTCNNPSVPDGTACSTGDACFTGDTCVAGACTNGPAVTCTASDQCHVAGTCEAATGACTNPAAPNGTTCNDGNPCTVGDVCGDGTCAGTPVTCTALDSCHSAGTCDPSSGVCSNPVIPGCDVNPTQATVFEPNASFIGTVVDTSGNPVTGYSLTVYDAPATGSPRTDLSLTTAGDGSFRARLTQFPTSEPAHSPPHHEIVQIESPTTILVIRDAFLHPGDATDLGIITVTTRDSNTTIIGPAGGTVVDSQNLVELDIPAGAVTAPTGITITTFPTRAAVPYPLPDVTATTYAFALEPAGLQLAQPATIRVANTLNLPTQLLLPVGVLDQTEGRWLHESLATWDGARFASTITHFSDRDLNPPVAGSWGGTGGGGPNGGSGGGGAGGSGGSGGDPCAGSTALFGNGSMRETVSLPTYQRLGQPYGVTLAYDSNLTFGASSTAAVPSTSYGAVPHSTLEVGNRGLYVGIVCVQRPQSDVDQMAPTQPFSCTGSPGACSDNWPAAANLTFTVTTDGSSVTQPLDLPASAVDFELTSPVNLPLSSTDDLAATGFQKQTFSVSPQTTTTCVTGGAAFGAQLGTQTPVATNQTLGTIFRVDRHTFVHHRHASPFGAGWAVQDVGRFYRDPSGDIAVLTQGSGFDEWFTPRVTTSVLPGAGGSYLTMAHDHTTGNSYLISDTGEIGLLGPTGTVTPVLTGLTFSGGPMTADVTYVSGTLHFVVALSTGLYDIPVTGGQTLLMARTSGQETVFTEPGVAAYNGVAYYTTGQTGSPILYSFQLGASPTPVALTLASGGDIGLDPQATLSGISFTEPHGLAFNSTGALDVADRPRNVVYQIQPQSNGSIGPASVVTRLAGDGSAFTIEPVGYRYPGVRFPLAEPINLSVADDGTLWITNPFGAAAYDPVATEIRWLAEDGTVSRSELTYKFGSAINGSSMLPSMLGLSASTLLLYQANSTLLQLSFALSSELDPTRNVSFADSGIGTLTDTTQGLVETYDAAGRLTQRSKQTGELISTVGYVDSSSDLIATIGDPIGSAFVFSYDGNGHLASVGDPSGKISQFTVTSGGDLVQLVKPDQETWAFQYADHRISQKTSPRGDVTTYQYAADGTISQVTKPAGETSIIAAAYSQPTQYNGLGNLFHAGTRVDQHGVTHAFTLHPNSSVLTDQYTASGVSYAISNVPAGTLYGPGNVDSNLYTNINNTLIGRISYTQNNSLVQGLEKYFDSQGRLAFVPTSVSGTTIIEEYAYDNNGNLATYAQGPANDGFQITRDAAGHVLKIAEVTGTTPEGHEVDYTWNALGLPATYTEHGVTTTYTYDANGNVQSTVDTVGQTTAFTRDASGNPLTSNNGATTTTFTYDTANRVITSADALGNTTTYSYALPGCGCSQDDLVTSVHTPDLPVGVAWTMQYEAEGRLQSVTDPDGFPESYAYAPTGELTQLVDRNGNATNSAYDQLGRLVSVVDAINRAHARAYPVPTSTGWTGPTLLAGSASATVPTTSLTGTLNTGDYQIGTNGDDLYAAGSVYASRSEPQVSLYQDATFQLSYGLGWDGIPNLTSRYDRESLGISSPVALDPARGTYFAELLDPDGALNLAVIPGSQSGGTNGAYGNSQFSYNTEHDLTGLTGYAGTPDPYDIYAYTRDALGRLTGVSRRFQASSTFFNSSTYAYYPDGNLMQRIDGDGEHDYSYDTRGLLYSISIPGEGEYIFTYDSLERNETLTYPDGHQRVQMYDNEGRLISRCYEYTGGLESRCYAASYDPVGNPVTMTDPEGTDILTYDSLNRLTQVSRSNGDVEDYGYNSLGALSVNAGALLNVQKPALNGSGMADSAVPATYNGLPVTLDPAGRIISLNGATLTFGRRSELQQIVDGTTTEMYGEDGYLRRISRVNNQGVGEYYAYEDTTLNLGGHSIGPAASTITSYGGLPAFDRTPTTLPTLDSVSPQNIVAVLESGGAVTSGILYDGVDQPLRLSRSGYFYYYEVDLAGNVRRLRDINGNDLGGYRYTAFGEEYAADATTPTPTIVQPLQWKGRWASTLAGGIYDVRARQWSPGAGVFLGVDEFALKDQAGTLWAWGEQSPTRLSDPSGRAPHSPPWGWPASPPSWWWWFYVFGAPPPTSPPGAPPNGPIPGPPSPTPQDPYGPCRGSGTITQADACCSKLCQYSIFSPPDACPITPDGQSPKDCYGSCKQAAGW